MSLRWLYLAVLGPLVLLAGLAWWGTQAQLKAAWTEAREQSDRLVEARLDDFRTKLWSRTLKAPMVEEPPQPGVASELDEILDGTDREALKVLSGNPDAGRSPAGLPRQVLAMLRLHQLDPDAQAPGDKVMIVQAHPSVISGRALEAIDASQPVRESWQLAETPRRMVREHGGDPQRGFWRLVGDELWWVSTSPDGAEVQFVLPRDVRDALDALGHGLPPWAHLQASASSRVLAGPASGIELHAARFPFGTDGALALFADPVALEAPIRRQQRWTLALLSVAVLTAGIALASIHRTVSRERRLAEMKSQFVSSVSHELRAPLGSIRLMAEALQQEKVARPAEFHTLIAREGARLSHLIENVLDFARIEDGRKRYQFEESDLSALVRETLRLMQPLARDRGVQLAFDLDEVTATVDPGAIQQAIVNLLDNALKFSPAGSVVHVRLHDSESRWQLSIRDHGPGIAKADQHAIFERFHRLGNELRRETQGAGIGLSIVRHIAEAHHGTITVRSTPPDGSTFTLDLPLITDH